LLITLQRYTKIFYKKVKINFFIRKVLFIFAEIKYEIMDSTKEKAKELYYRYYQIVADSGYPEEKAKQCALIAVDEILEIINETMILVDIESDYDYYLEVKQEILKL
jgi:hypothetical protein